jgi:gliding-associated putative ABC transporter substrate-binding component GldG
MKLKKKDVLSFVYLLVGLAALAAVSERFNFRIDLTEDKRFSLSEQSRATMEGLDDAVFARVYLDGEMPVTMKKFRTAVKEKLDELQRYAGRNFRYEFRNPSDGNEEKRAALFRELDSKGMVYLNIYETDTEGGSTRRTVFPGALINYRGRETTVNFVQNNTMFSAEENLNLALQNLEYELVNAIVKVTGTTKKKVAFVEGHGELDDISLFGIFESLDEYYEIKRVKLNGETGILDEYDVTVIAKPMQRWSEADKFVLDAYIMNGGKTAWFIDAVHVHEDSLSSGELTMGLVCRHNLDDQLFNYGVRINHNVIQDLQCGRILVSDGRRGEPAGGGFRPVPWTYFPLLFPPPDNPVTKGVNLVRTQYPGVIDTVGSDRGVRKTYLLYSSEKSKVTEAPLIISLSQVDERITERNFDRSRCPVAVMMEGEFNSPFRNRIVSKYTSDPNFRFKPKSAKTKMIVVSDGDVIRNDAGKTGPLRLGFDRFTGLMYGNREFATNIVNYLADEKGLMDLKNRTYRLRLLDKSKIAEYHSLIIFANTALPVIAVALCGTLFVYRRKKKWKAVVKQL